MSKKPSLKPVLSKKAASGAPKSVTLSLARTDNTPQTPSGDTPALSVSPKRLSIRELLQHIFYYDKERDTLATEIERGCFRRTCSDTKETFWTPTFVDYYSSVCYTVLHALSPNTVGGMTLQMRILDNSVSPSSLAWMSAEELDPNANSGLRELIELRSNQKIEYRVSTMYICPRKECGKRQTNGGEEQQRRAADEGSSLKLLCLACGHRWQIG